MSSFAFYTYNYNSNFGLRKILSENLPITKVESFLKTIFDIN